MEVTLEQMAVFTFRELSEMAQQYLSVEKVAWIIRHRFDYMSTLTYKQKCLVSQSRIVEVVQRRLEKSGFYVAKSLIRLVMHAEESCYSQLFFPEEMDADQELFGMAA